MFQQFCHRFSYRYIPPPVNSCIPVHITLRVPNRSNLKFQVRVLDFNVHISNGFTALFTKLANTIASDQKSENKPVGCCVSYSIGFFFNQPHLTADPGRVLVFTWRSILKKRVLKLLSEWEIRTTISDIPWNKILECKTEVFYSEWHFLTENTDEIRARTG